MSKNIFITGTGTDVGKTYVTGLLVKKLKDLGFKSGYYKAAVSGNSRINNILIPGDALFVKKKATLDENPLNMVSYIYEQPISPHLAAKLEGNPVELDKIKNDFKNICQKYDFITVEGSGGIICPLRFDDKKIMLEDVIKMLDLSVIIVANSGLGSINATVLTVNYLKQKNIKIKGIILNYFYKGNILEEDNKKMIETLTEIPVIACVKNNEKNIEIENLEAFYE